MQPRKGIALDRHCTFLSSLSQDGECDCQCRSEGAGSEGSGTVHIARDNWFTEKWPGKGAKPLMSRSACADLRLAGPCVTPVQRSLSVDLAGLASVAPCLTVLSCI